MDGKTGKHAYLIMTHGKPDQTRLLLRSLDHPHNDIFVLIDQKSATEPEDFEGICRHSRFEAFKPFPVYWGGVSLIRAELFLFGKGVQTPHDYYHLLSGQDFPLKTQTQIHDFFADKTQQFVHFHPETVHCAEWKAGFYHFFVDGFNFGGNHFWKLARKALVGLQMALRIRRNPKKLRRHGSQWVSITHDFAQYLVDRSELILKEYSYTYACDEVFIQTELLNSPFWDQRASCSLPLTANLRLIDWARRQGNSPHTWRIDDLEDLKSSPCLFARKFDVSIDSTVVKEMGLYLGLSTFEDF
jgi:hypothetical protein